MLLPLRPARAVCVAVNAIKSALRALACHLSLCMLLKLRFFVDSILRFLPRSFMRICTSETPVFVTTS